MSARAGGARRAHIRAIRTRQSRRAAPRAEFARQRLYSVKETKPGFIGKLGTLLGDAKVNIANFTLGRSAPGQDAIALIEVDGPVPAEVADGVAKLPQVKHAKPLAF